MRGEKERNRRKTGWKFLGILAFGGYFAFAGMLLFGIDGQAYIDPSVMTYVIQAVSGVVIAVGAGIGIYWRKAKKKLDQKLDLDENKKKEVESDDIEVYKK